MVPTIVIDGMENGLRVSSRILDERIQKAVSDGHRKIEVIAYGQHGLGGRIWTSANDPVELRIVGSSGQRVGAMGLPGTRIDVEGAASDDLGWLNAGACITVKGHATNGVGNAMAQGKIYVGGDIGARGMTMTKHNPRLDPPELWVLGGAGDFFAEFMAGGTAVICGYDAAHGDNVLGYRPCVGMVGGKILFRGPIGAFSERDAALRALDDTEWAWLTEGLKDFLGRLGRTELLKGLTSDRNAWRVLAARHSYEKGAAPRRTMKDFREQSWDAELGKGGLIGDIAFSDRSPVPVLATGNMRRFIPVWENEKYLPPCQANCPTGIPVRKRWDLIRRGKIQEAVDLALLYTPFPATVCGYLCPNLCMQNCTRHKADLEAVDTRILGKASLNAKAPTPLPDTGKRIAVIGAGPSGLSVAWQLRLKGHRVEIFDSRMRPGGKITGTIPRSRIPEEVIEHEIKRIEEMLAFHALNHPLTKDEFGDFRHQFDIVVIAVGAQKPRIIPIPGSERVVPALTFLKESRLDRAKVGRRVVIIGAGNVGCDAATEAFRLGAESVVLIDVQKPSSSEREQQNAKDAGAVFLWPRFTKAITADGVELRDGETLGADMVIMAVGDLPELDFLPEDIKTERGFIVVDDTFRTTAPNVYAVGDSVRLGLLTEAIGAGRKAARAIDNLLRGEVPPDPKGRGNVQTEERLFVIPPGRVKLEYYDPRPRHFEDIASCAANCASCGGCRDCGMCETACPQGAISRKEGEEGFFEYTVNGELCIGCGTCAGVCPTGVWNLVPNEPLK